MNNPEKSAEVLVACSQMKKELMNVIFRYGQESNVSVYACIGALEVVKAELMEWLGKQAEQDGLGK